MALPSVLLGVRLKMEVGLTDMVVEKEGPSDAVVVVVVDLPLEPKGRVAMEEAGVLMPEARFQTSARDVGIGIAVVTPV